MSRQLSDNKENIPPRKTPWFRHHNPGTRYVYDGPKKPRVQVLSSIVIVPPKSPPRNTTHRSTPGDPIRGSTPRTPRKPRPASRIPQTPRRPKPTLPLPETPRANRNNKTPRRLHLQARPKRPPTPPRFQIKARPRHEHKSRRSRIDLPTSRRYEDKPRRPRFIPPTPRSPSPPKRTVILRPSTQWRTPQRLSLVKPGKPRFYDATGKDPRSRNFRVIITVPPPDTPIRRPSTPKTPSISPVPSPIRPFIPTPRRNDAGQLPIASRTVFFKKSKTPGRRRLISLTEFSYASQ